MATPVGVITVVIVVATYCVAGNPGGDGACGCGAWIHALDRSSVRIVGRGAGRHCDEGGGCHEQWEQGSFHSFPFAGSIPFQKPWIA
jgi:hypothetical protein